MTKLEKVIKGLEACKSALPTKCEQCPYQTDKGSDCFRPERDALELLKGQEPKHIKKEKELLGVVFGNCPGCGIWISHPCVYCGFCGQAVKWDD